MPAGRPPKPASLHLMQGTGRKDRHGDLEKAAKEEAKLPPIQDVPPPDGLEPDELEAWRYFVEDLGPMALAKKKDRTALCQLCVLYAAWLRAVRRIHKLSSGGVESPDGFTVESTNENTGVTTVKAHPIYAIESDLRRGVLTFLGRFGLTPADRASIMAGRRGSAEKAGAKTGDDEFGD